MQWSKERREHWLEIEEVTVSIDWLGSHFDWKKQSRVFLFSTLVQPTVRRYARSTY